jgi:penicillin-binding protein 2
MAVLVIRLFLLTVVDGADLKKEGENNTIKTIYSDAPRGNIYDKNGEILATNIPTYSVDLSIGNMNSEQLNSVIIDLLNIFNKNGDKIVDNFPIILNQDGSYSYTFDAEIANYLATQGLSSDMKAKAVFEEMRRRHNIPEGMEKFAAQEALVKLGVYVPISVKDFTWIENRDKKDFLEKYGVKSTKTSAKAAFEKIIEAYDIPKDLNPGSARQVMQLRYELTSLGYMKYIPARIAMEISEKSVLELEERSNELQGVSVILENIRYYPKGELASHVLGYLGKISDDNKEDYVKNKGYKPTDMIGLDGIEQSMEDVLRGTDGTQNLQVNASGEIMRQLGEVVKPQKGKDIVLSIDSRLQKIAEESVDKAVEAVRKGGTYQSKWTTYKYNHSSPVASQACAVVLDVKTGEPIAYAMSENYDPNLFARGISSADWASLQPKNPRDPLSPIPLYDIVAKMSVQPGSTFKPLIASMALEKGLDPDRKLTDKGVIEIGSTKYSCLQWNTYGGTHGQLDLYKALEVSCNYYFFDLATGKDQANGTSLGYNSPVNIDEIARYAKMFGLGQKTGIELQESVVPAPTSTSKIENIKAQLKNWLLSQSNYVFKNEIYADKNKLNKAIDTIVSWTDEDNIKLSVLRKRMQDIGIKKEEVELVADTCKFTYYNYSKWTEGDSFNIGIGQGETQFTPLQMANYIATIGNGGYLNNISLIRAIEDTASLEKKPASRVEIKEENLKIVIEGMRRVAAQGSLRGTLGKLDISAGGKTGTAQRSGKINPPDEVEYVKKNLSKINSQLSWPSVEAEMVKIMADFPDLYGDNPNGAVRKAVRNLSGRDFDVTRIDAYKADNVPFGWVVGLAPTENPEIAVVGMVVQGGESAAPAPIVNDLISAYFELKKSDEESGKKAMNYEEFFKDVK